MMTGVALDRAAKPPRLYGMVELKLEQFSDLTTVLFFFACYTLHRA